MIKAKLEVIYNLYKSDRESTHLTAEEAFGALRSIFGEKFLDRSIFDKFNQNDVFSLQDLAILLIQLDTYFQLLPTEDVEVSTQVKEKRGRSLIRAFSKSMRRMVSRGPESANKMHPPNPQVSIREIDVGSYLLPDSSNNLESVNADKIPPPRTPEDPPTDSHMSIATVSDLVDRLEKLERVVYNKT